MKRALLVALVRAVSGAQARWTVEPTIRQSIYFANHTSHLDAVVLWACLPPAARETTRPVAAKDYWNKSRMRRHLADEVFRAVLIDRTRVTVQNNPVTLMVEAMEQGASLIIFPEGSRGTGDEVVAFKSGLFHLAQHKPDAALVPCFIENLNRILPKGEFLPVPLLSSITFGAPLAVLAGETKGDFLERARQAVCALRPNV